MVVIQRFLYFEQLITLAKAGIHCMGVHRLLTSLALRAFNALALFSGIRQNDWSETQTRRTLQQDYC